MQGPFDRLPVIDGDGLMTAFAEPSRAMLDVTYAAVIANRAYNKDAAGQRPRFPDRSRRRWPRS
jgi:hypothetical protein